MLPGMLSSCKQQGGQACFFQKASFSKALIFFPVLKRSDLATCLQVPIAWWQSLPRPSRTRQCHTTTMDSATAPEHHKLLGPCSHTLVTPFSLGLASNWAAAQTHRPQTKDPRSRSKGHTPPEIDVLSNSHGCQKDLSWEILFYSLCLLAYLLFQRSGFTSYCTFPKPSLTHAGRP